MQFPVLFIPRVLHTSGAGLSPLARMRFPRQSVAVVGGGAHTIVSAELCFFRIVNSLESGSTRLCSQ